MYHEKHFTYEQLAYLQEQKIPPTIFNAVKYFANRILGFMSSTVNTVKITAQQIEDIPIAAINHDMVNYIYRMNGWDTVKGQSAITQYLLTGIFCVSCMPVKSGKVDQFGRPQYEIEIENVSVYDIILDPASKKSDYSDARFIHRRMLMTKDEMMLQFPDKHEEIAALNPGNDSVGSDYGYHNRFTENNYGYTPNNGLYDVVHSVIVDNKQTNDETELDTYSGETNNPRKERIWSIYWCGDQILQEKEITYREVRFPYVVYKLHEENIENEFYGIFRGIVPMQKAINSAIIATHRVINTAKKFVAPNAVKDLNKFAEQLSNPDESIIEVDKIEGIIDAFGSQAQEAQNQLLILNNDINLLREQLGINLAFIGDAPASDSGRKVQIQREASIAALNSIQRRIQQPYRVMGRNICKYISQYYRATQVFNIVERDVAQRWVEINSPALIAVREPVIMQAPNGEVYLDHQSGPQILDENGEPVFRYHFEQAIDPETNEFMVGEDGETIWAPVPTLGSEIRNFDPDIIVDSTAYDNEQQVAIDFAHNLLNSAAGTLLAQVDPAAYLEVFAELARGAKTLATSKVADALLRAAEKIVAAQQAQGTEGNGGGGEVQQAGVNNVPGAGGN